MTTVDIAEPCLICARATKLYLPMSHKDEEDTVNLYTKTTHVISMITV